ncbi:MAG: flagellar protein FlgN [Gammaproteobacteria bacterium]|jgi:flagella synthesis protein FlgN|nr:flagellar protein FlgN [Gammaproteobacteria bacterium]
MRLISLLRAQYDRLSALTSLLEQEREALANGSIDGELLQRIAADKQTLLVDLEQSEQERRTEQTAQGYPEGDAGARQAAADAGCLGAWNAVRGASERAAHLNELVGAMVTMRLQHNRKMLDLIHTISEKTLYDTRGRSRAQPSQIRTSA